MAWPITFNLNSTGIGSATSGIPGLLAWGTDGMINSTIVKTIRSTPMVEEVKIEQGGGLTATQILLNDGDEIEFTVVDDRAITWPLTGATITVINPQPNGTNGTSQLFQVINNNYSTARKTDGERTIMAKRFRLIVPTQM